MAAVQNLFSWFWMYWAHLPEQWSQTSQIFSEVLNEALSPLFKPPHKIGPNKNFLHFQPLERQQVPC